MAGFNLITEDNLRSRFTVFDEMSEFRYALPCSYNDQDLWLYRVAGVEERRRFVEECCKRFASVCRTNLFTQLHHFILDSLRLAGSNLTAQKLLGGFERS
jgi:hypothetical protein